jgi:hypothetical protein
MARSEPEFAAARASLLGDAGPVLAQIKVLPERLPLVLPPREGALLRARFRRALLGAAADSE